MPIEVKKNEDLFAPVSEYGNLRSDAMSELISRKPGFLGKWALFIFLFILILFGLATWFIKYPDVIKVNAALVATNAPKEIIARQEGRLIKLFVHNDEIVSEGTVIGFIESTAKHDQVLLLRECLLNAEGDIHKDSMQNILNRFSTNFADLGELQQGYQQFSAAFQQFCDYLQDGFYMKKKKILVEDLSFLTRNYEIVLQQKKLLTKDLNLSEETYKANESLLKDKVISKQDDRNELSKLLNKQLSIPQINVSLLNTETLQREKQREITELEHSIFIQKKIFLQAVQTLKSLLDEWVKKYIIKTPVAGKMNFLMPLQENEYIKSGRSLGFVVPSNSQYYAEITIPQHNFGKAATNQIVQLRFDAYPYQEFGFVLGQINYISDIPTDSGFVAHVRMPWGLITNQKRDIKYREGLRAEALIITKNMRLAERFYYNLTSTLNR